MHDLAARFVSLWSASTFEESALGHAPQKGLKDAVVQLQDAVALQQQGIASSTGESEWNHAKILLLQSDVLMDLAREMLHAFPYKEVPACWRELYTDAGILKALALGILASARDRNIVSGMDNEISLLRKALSTCDQVLVMAGASGQGRKAFVFAVIDTLETKIQSAEVPSLLPSKRKNTAIEIGQGEKKGETDRVGGIDRTPRIQHPIPRIHLPTMDDFQNHVNGPLGGTPLIITGAMDHWPALERWKDPKMICKIAGPDRLVPIEIGSQYTDEQWTQKLVTMKDFVEQFVDGGIAKGQVGYLAQHNVFDQIPRLRRDIDIPDYCLVAPRHQDGYQPPEDVLLNAWFGPGGTISPMHTDPYFNLLAQVVGQKYVRLYSPSETPKLYSFASSSDAGAEDEVTDKGSSVSAMLGNTSQVEVEEPDLTKFPLFASAEYVEAVLEAGELLYIPLQWWHYIRSLSTSFSVSFWF